MKTRIFLVSIFIIALSLSLVNATTYIGAETEPWQVPPYSDATFIIGRYDATHYYAKNASGYGLSANQGYQYYETDFGILLNETQGAWCVKILAGTYALNSRVVISDSYRSFVGESYGSVEIDYGANGAISLEGSGSILGTTFTNIFFDGQGTTATNPAISSRNQSDAYRVELKMERCKVRGFRGTGVYMLDLKNAERLMLYDDVFDNEGRVTSWNGALIYLWGSNINPSYYPGNHEIRKCFFNARFAFGCAINISGTIYPMGNETHSIVSFDNQFYLDQDQYQANKDVDYAYWMYTYGGPIIGFSSDHDRTENTNFLNSTGLNDTSRGFITHGLFGIPTVSGVPTANSTYPFIWLGRYTWGWTIGDNDFSGGVANTVCIQDSNIYSTRPTNVHDNYFKTTSGSPTWISPATGTNIHYNYGFISEAWGTNTTAANGGLQAHGLSATPTQVYITSGNGTNLIICGVTSITSYGFTYILNRTSTVTGQTVYWYAVYQP